MSAFERFPDTPCCSNTGVFTSGRRFKISDLNIMYLECCQSVYSKYLKLRSNIDLESTLVALLLASNRTK